MKLTKKELERVIYHVEYDTQSIDEDNYGWKEMEKDRRTSRVALGKLRQMLEEIK
ncbi:MAG: hypothetical protein QGH82_06860 [Candidatus Woesearchaeota archaeon]|jgi:hypothetical protein|nr:hypothetical protein [Candidatus Woesearchaeota archaeon]